MDSELGMSREDHIAWTDSINMRLDCIYKELCDFEVILNQNSENSLPLMELLESANEMHATAQTIRPINDSIRTKKEDLQEKINLLEKSIELLKLESQTKKIEVMEE